MEKWKDKIWMWQGWPIVKYPFGVFILWVVLSQIWYLETVKDYDKIIIKNTVTAIESIKIPSFKFDKPSIFSSERMIFN